MRSTLLTILLVPVLTGALYAQDIVRDNARREIVNKLNTQRITVDFRAVSLQEAIDFIRDFSGINIVVHNSIHTEMSEDDLTITIKVKDLLLKSVLKLMLDTRGMTALYREGVLLIVPKGKAFSSVKTKIYDIRDMLFKIRDFPGPQVELSAPGGGPSLPGATFTLEEEPESTLPQELIEELIQETTGGETWDENENVSMSLTNGLLIVTQSAKVHREIYRLLQLLRQYQ